MAQLVPKMILFCVLLSSFCLAFADDHVKLNPDSAINIAFSKAVKLNVESVTNIAKTDDNFICATLDWWPSDKCDYGQCPWGQAGLLNLVLHAEKAPSIKKKVSFEDITDKPENRAPGRTGERTPSTAWSPSFADKNLDMTDRKKPEASLPIPYLPPIDSSMTRPVENKIKKAMKFETGDAKADSWEKAEMVSIKERYEKMMVNVEKWGTKKKARAKRKIATIEAELDRRRVKAMKRYRDSINRIEGIAKGAKAQAEETRRNEELKAKEKANKIRATGKLPATCLCF